MRFKLVLILLMLLVLAGCARQYRVTVDAINSPTVPMGGSYVLLPGDGKTGPEDLLFQTIAGYLQRVMASKGFVRVQTLEEAEQVITLAYEVSGPQIISNVHTEYWGGRYHDYGHYGRTYTTHHKVYTRNLIIKAYEAQSYNQDQRVQHWRASGVSTGVSSDLRKIAPVLIRAVEPYLGVNTAEQVKVVVKADDERLQEISGGVVP